MKAAAAAALLFAGVHAEEVCIRHYKQPAPGKLGDCTSPEISNYTAEVGKCYYTGKDIVSGKANYEKFINITEEGTYRCASPGDKECSTCGFTRFFKFGTCYHHEWMGNPFYDDTLSAGACGAPACKDIVALAQSVPDLSTLVTAVVAGGLVKTLESPGPFTVFAPTNEAFAALPAGTLEKLLKPENKAQLDDILTYHVLAAKVLSTDLKDGEKAKTVEGKEVTAHVSKSGVKINDANVVQADVLACNGVVHVIDAVLLPPSA